MSVKSTWIITSVSFLISLLSFYLVVLCKRGVLKSPIISVWGLMYELSSSNVSLTYVGPFILRI